MRYLTVLVGMMLLLGSSHLSPVWARDTGLDFYAVDRFVKNITTQGMYAKRFRLWDLRVGGYEIPLFLDFLSDPASNGPLGPFWAMPLLESRLIPAGRNQMTFVSVTGEHMLLDLPEKGAKRKSGGLWYAQMGKKAELSFMRGKEGNSFFFENNRLVRWRISSRRKSVSLSIKRKKTTIIISSSASSKPLLQLAPFNEDEKDGFRMRTAAHSFEFMFTDYDNLFDEELGSVGLLSSFSADEAEPTRFMYNGFSMRQTDLMESAGQQELYKKFLPKAFHPKEREKEKARRYAWIVSDGPLGLDVTWNMNNGFSVLCGKNLCLVAGGVGQWNINSNLWGLRSDTNPDRWEMMGVDWRTGRRIYQDSNGYKMTENIILTPGENYLKPRSGEAKIPGSDGYSYKICYDKEGNEESSRFRVN